MPLAPKASPASAHSPYKEASPANTSEQPESEYSTAWPHITHLSKVILTKASLFLHFIKFCVLHFSHLVQHTGDESSEFPINTGDTALQHFAVLLLRAINFGIIVLGILLAVGFQVVIASWKSTTITGWPIQPACFTSLLGAYLFNRSTSSATFALVILFGCFTSGFWFPATGNFFILRTTSTISLVFRIMQRSLDKSQGSSPRQQPGLKTMTTDGTTAMPGAGRPIAEEMLRETQRQQEKQEREQNDAKQRERLRYWKEEAQRAEDTRRRAEKREREARESFREQLRHQQKELQRDAQRQRDKQHECPRSPCGTPRAGTSRPSAQTAKEKKEEEELSEAQARRSKAWKEAYDELTGKSEEGKETKWEEIAQKQAAEKARRQNEFKAWSQRCRDLLKHPSSVTKIPEPPYTPCHQPGCSAPRYLEGCSHSVARVFTDARLSQSELESEHRFWHPDRAHFRQVPEPYKDGVLKMADEVFKAMQPVVNASRS